MTENYKDVLVRAKIEAPSAIIQYFQSETSGDTVISFVEGDDDRTFYVKFIEDLANSDDILFINCGNKEGVIRAYSQYISLSEKKAGLCTLFICDKDYDDYIGAVIPGGIFRTDYYSIENYMYNEQFVGKALMQFCGVSRARDRERIISDLFRTIDSYVDTVSAILASLIVERKVSSAFDADGNSIMKFLAWDDVESRLKRVDVLDIMKIMGVPENLLSDVINTTNSIESEDILVWFRGKYLLQFIRSVIDHHFDNDVMANLKSVMSRKGLALVASYSPELLYNFQDYIDIRKLQK